MSTLARRMIGESHEAKKHEKPLMVLKEQRPVYFDVCPHCKKEIFEKHTYIDGDFESGRYVERHSDCGGAIQFPSTPANQIPEWLRPYGQEAIDRHAAYIASL